MMTNFKDWDYKEMGFRSEAEMWESIARVERRMKMSDVEVEIEKRREANSMIDDRGRINLEALNEGARLEGLDRVVHDRILYEKEQSKRKAEQEEMQSLLTALADDITADNEAKAQREMQKEKEKAEAELQQEIYSKHGVKTDKEKQLDEVYSKLLGSLIK